MMDKNSKIYVAGHTGLVGASIVRKLRDEGYSNIVCVEHQCLDLRDRDETLRFFKSMMPEYVFMSAATVGGVAANNEHPAKFFYDNIMMGVNVIDSAFEIGVKKLMYMGSSCLYPRDAEQPMREDSLLKGRVEPTNEAYAMAKISCIKMCEFYNKEYGTDYISCMPCNAYGPGDNYNLETSHVVAALLRKFHEAKMGNYQDVVMWGSGNPLREFIYIDDIADAAVFLMNNYSGNETVNVGTGTEISIRELAETIKRVVGYSGRIVNDLSKPDGSPRKLIDSSKIFKMGWKPKTNFEDGIRQTYLDYVKRNEKKNER